MKMCLCLTIIFWQRCAKIISDLELDVYILIHECPTFLDLMGFVFKLQKFLEHIFFYQFNVTYIIYGDINTLPTGILLIYYLLLPIGKVLKHLL